MRILILGGDGYLGWPTAMRFSDGGHEVHVVDNYLRRRAHEEVGTDTLVPDRSARSPNEPPPGRRSPAERSVSPRATSPTGTDLRPVPLLPSRTRSSTTASSRPPPTRCVDRDHAVFTQQNNVVNTLNVLWAMREFAPDCHLVKLGTMGEYGTPNIDIEEGYLEIEHNGPERNAALPEAAGQSLYHLSKVHDSQQHPLRLPDVGDPRDRPEPGRRLRDRDRADEARRPPLPRASTTTTCSVRR